MGRLGLGDGAGLGCRRLQKITREHQTLLNQAERTQFNASRQIEARAQPFRGTLPKNVDRGMLRRTWGAGAEAIVGKTRCALGRTFFVCTCGSCEAAAALARFACGDTIGVVFVTSSNDSI